MTNMEEQIRKYMDSWDLSEADEATRSALEGFLSEWFSPSPMLRVHTSGSTGKPKELLVRKEQMRNSAVTTCRFLGLQAKDSALLCMPLQYIAGKMVVVRAITSGLHLIVQTPSGHPMKSGRKDLRFAAMIPLQVFNSLQDETEREALRSIRQLIIGGGAIDADMEEELRHFPNAVYSTYGMTETLSHIALRLISGEKASGYYTPFEEVGLSLSDDGTLIIDAPRVCDTKLVTNDIAELLPDQRFRIIGRRDNTINTGGIKVQIEVVEEKLKPHLSAPFAITYVKDAKFGNAVVLLLEAPARIPGEQLNEWLPVYERPKHCFAVDSIPQTGSGKTDRAHSHQLAEACLAQTQNN